MKKAIVSLALALVAAVAFALPTTQDVEAQVRQGNYSQAEAMMNEVVTARPGSARAHYVYAEILAHNRNFAKAADEAQKARQIDPALSFTDPAKFRVVRATAGARAERVDARHRDAVRTSDPDGPERRPHHARRAGAGALRRERAACPAGCGARCWPRWPGSRGVRSRAAARRLPVDRHGRGPAAADRPRPDESERRSV